MIDSDIRRRLPDSVEDAYNAGLSPGAAEHEITSHHGVRAVGCSHFSTPGTHEPTLDRAEQATLKKLMKKAEGMSVGMIDTLLERAKKRRKQ